MILVLDNYDSFTYNLVQYLGELGAKLEVRRNDQVTRRRSRGTGARTHRHLARPCTPKEAGISVSLIQRLAGKVPILGVCLGHQSIGEAFGGKVVRAPYLMHGKTSSDPSRRQNHLPGLPQDFTATRYHSLIVERDSLPAELEISAQTSDGLIMGLRHKQHRVEGVQFHPESILTETGKKLLRNFLEL